MSSELDPQQLAAVHALQGPVCILAGAGTGKTRTITHRIACAVQREVVQAHQVLAVTFTTKAAGQLRDRLDVLGLASGHGFGPGVQALTFHAAASRQLRYFAPRVLGGYLPRLVEEKHRLVAEAAAACNLQVSRTELDGLASEIEWAKATLISPQMYASHAVAASRTPLHDFTTISQVYAAYEDLKVKACAVDFSDLLLILIAAIEEHRDVAEELRSRYRHFIIDEYQDVTPLQQRLLDAWLGERDDICVVGDPNQTIYSFAGANPNYLLEFPRRYPGTTVIRLDRNYRSTPQVVDLANHIVRTKPTRLIGQLPAGPLPSLVSYPDELREAAAIAKRCSELIEGGMHPTEIAVLYRTNAQAETYEPALAAAGVPYVLYVTDTHRAREASGVTLASIHAAKGLEWDAVFLVGLSEGTLPIAHAMSAAQLAEENRLFYVGVTRARKLLMLSWSLSQSASPTRFRRRSRFLDGVILPPPSRISVERDAIGVSC